MKRDDDELNKLKQERRPGRPPSNREDLLLQRIETEKKEYESGFWVPDLMEDDGAEGKVARLQTWNGEWSSLNALAFVRISRDGEVSRSSFPPR